MSDQHFEKKLRQQIDDLDKTIMPRRDLWPGIEIALAAEATERDNVDQSRPQRARMLAAAASVAFVGLLSWTLVKQPAPVDTVTPQMDVVSALVSQHEEQKDALLVKFQDQPALTQNWQEQLKELDKAAVAIKKALQQEPNNLALLKMLQNVHQQQIDLIERVHSPKWRQI